MLITRYCGARAVVLAALMTTGSACVVTEDVEPAGYAESYEPLYYDGYVVYYDDVGRPYYYENGAVIWVPPTSPLYVGFVDHWRYHRPAYSHWYAHEGYRYRTHRSVPARRHR
jgi:hypothetical protein